MKRTSIYASILLFACGKSAPPPADATAVAERAIPAAGILAEEAGAQSLAENTPDAAAVTPPVSAPVADPPPPKDACIPASAELENAARVPMRKCYEDAAKKKPGLAGEVRIAVNVDAHGKISSTKPIDKSTLGDKVVDCMAKAVKATAFDGAKCSSRTLQITHPYPH